ncbi:MAG: PDZ domain-containing protein [Bryobacteraceae bacterium]|nr:PDZ domain-containing protein [Bryobacteraceae bacterium]
MRRRLVVCILAAAAGFATYPPSPDGRGDESKPGSYLGIGVQEIYSDRAKELGLKESRGVEITLIVENGPAAKAGFRVGDVVLEFAGEPVEGIDRFIRLVRDTPSGKSVRVGVIRAGASRHLTMTTGARRVPSMRELDWNMSGIDAPEIAMPDVPRANMTWRSPFLGVDVERPDPQLAEYFGVKDGVLVRSVMKGSPADRAGLRAGDVIVRIEEFKISSAREITGAIRSARSKKSVSVYLVRERRDQTVSVSFEE